MADAKIRLSVDGTAQVVSELGTVAAKMGDLQNTVVSAGSAIKSALLGASALLGTLAIADKIKDMAMLSARFETLGASMTVVGKNAGYTKEQMDANALALQKTGISMIESRQQTMRLVQAHIDLSASTKLARIAQDAAVIGNMNSSEAFAHMIHGIQTGQTDVLRTIGLNVSMEQSYKQMAATLHKNADQLSQNEKTQAVLNAVLAEGKGIAGTYEAAMDTAGKQVLSMTRYSEDLKVKQGEVFNEVLTVAVMAYTGHLKNANGEMDEMAKNGELKAWGEDLALIFVNIANAIDNVLNGAKMVGNWVAHQSAGTEINKKFTDIQVNGSPEFPKKATAQGMSDQWDQLEKLRIKALADEQKFYEQSQVDMVSNADRFLKAYEDRLKAKAAKEAKSNTDSLSRQSDYQAKSLQVQQAYASSSVAVQQAAQQQLAQSFFGDNHKYSDTIATPDKGAAAAAEKATLEAKLERIKFALGIEKNLRTEAMAAVTELGRQGLASDAQIYQSKVEAALAAGTDVARIKQAEIDELEKYHGKDLAAKIANKTKIASLDAEKNQALRASLVAAKLLRDQYAYDREKPLRDAQDASTKEVAAIYEQVAATELQIKTYGLLPAAITAVKIADLQMQETDLVAFGGAEQVVNGIRQKIVALERLAQVQGQADAQNKGSDLTRATELLAVMSELDNVAKSAAQGMAASFGAVGTAIGGMTTALTGYSRAQAAIAAQLAASTRDAASDPTKLFKARATAAEQTAQAQISSYAGMTSAAKGFFDENSTGYRALEGAEKAFRAVEMAMAVEAMLTKSGLLAGFTGLFVASKATETAATVASVAPDIAASMAKGTVAAAVGVASQAQGDPYTAWPRMAAMIAAMAALGFAVSGGGGSGANVAKERQAAAGTGTVLGDAAAKSDSIAKSLDYMSKNSDIGLAHTAGMLAALHNIESSIGGLANVIGRSINIGAPATGTTLGFQSNQIGSVIHAVLGGGSAVSNLVAKIPVVGELLSGLMNKVGSLLSSGFGTKTSMLDQGIYAGAQTLGSVQSGGLNASGYADIEKTKKFLWIGYSTSVSTQFSGLSDEVKSQLSLVVNNLAAGTKSATELLGISNDQFLRSMSGFVVNLGKISLKGLSGEQVQKQFETIFSALGDNMARQAIPALASFQKVGEGYYQTLMRIATDYANVDAVLKSAGMVFGAVGLSSIGARERLIELAGGMDKLASGTKFFADNYLSEAERMAPVAQDVAAKMAAMGLASVTTRDQFKDAVLGLSRSGALATEAGAATYAGLMNVQEAFSLVHPEIDKTGNAAKTLSDILSERKSLQDQLDQATMTSAQLLQKQRDAIDGSNRALFDQVQAAIASANAAITAADAAKELTQAWQSVTNTLFDEVKRIRGLLDSDSGNYASAQTKFAVTTAQARAGDQEAAKLLPQLSQAMLALAEQNASSAIELARIRAMTANSLEETGKSYAKYAVKLPSFAVGTDYVPHDMIAQIHKGEMIVPAAFNPGGMNAELVAEIRALRQEVEQLRMENSAQNTAIAINTEKSAKVLTRNDTGGGLLTTPTIPA